MTKKSYKQKDGTLFEWEENEFILEYINQLQKDNARDTQRESQASSKKSKKSR